MGALASNCIDLRESASCRCLSIAPLFSHVPVLAEAVVDAASLLSRAEGLLIDATLGGGGHSALLLEPESRGGG